MPNIKLKDCIPSHVKEAIHLPPPTVSFLTKPEWHSYSKPAGNGAGSPYFNPNVDFSGGLGENNVVAQASNVIKKFENSENNPNGGYNKEKKLWFPHKSVEGGSATIAYGHKILPGEDFSEGITDSQATDLIHKDVHHKIAIAKKLMNNFDQFPITVKIATLNALYRGDLKKDVAILLAQHQFKKAAEKYLSDNAEQSSKWKGVKSRVNFNAEVFAKAQ